MNTTFAFHKTDGGFCIGFHDTERSLLTELTRFEMAALLDAITMCLQNSSVQTVSIRIAAKHAGDG